MNPETVRLKALSAESLRSVSPGSDSVFYSDPSTHAPPTEQQVHCLHCGKEVDIVTTDDPEKSASSNGNQPDIVQPPAGFADSPRVKHVSGKLYKKLDKRFRSEERQQAERRHHRYKHDVRAKVGVSTFFYVLFSYCRGSRVSTFKQLCTNSFRGSKISKMRFIQKYIYIYIRGGKTSYPLHL